MKSKLAALTLLTFALSCKTSKNKVYTIIKPASHRLENSLVDTTSLNSLSEPMKAVAYLYFSSTTHIESIPDPQSAEHLSLIRKYFPTVRSGKTIGQRPLKASLATPRNNYFTSLSLFQDKDTITASYAYDTIFHGEIISHNNEDVYIFDGKGLKRVE